MPRFVARPIIVEAVEFAGSIAFWPEPFRRAVGRHVPGGLTEIATGDGMRPLRSGDWVTRGPDGAFTVYRSSAFETYFAPVGSAAPVSLPDPEASTKRTTPKR